MNAIIRYRYSLIVAAAVIIFLLDFINLDILPETYHLEAKVLLFVHVAFFIRSFKYLKSLKVPIPLIISFFSTINYGYVFFVIPNNDYQLANMNYEIIDILILFFLSFYLIFFWLLDLKLTNLRFYKFKGYILASSKSVHGLKYGIIIIYFIDLFLGIPISGFAEVISNFALGSFFASLLLSKNKWYDNVILIVLLGFVFYQAFFSGFGYAILYVMIYLSSVFLIVGIYNNRLLNGIMLIAAFACLLLMNIISSHKLFLRTETEMTTVEKINYLFNAETDPNVDDYNIKNTTLWRASYQVSALSFVMEKTPKIVPFWNGASYVNIFLKFIPRVLWQDKPKENMGQRFGHIYGITRLTDERTSMNTPILVESYMNYSFFGFFLLIIVFSLTAVNLFFRINQRVISKDLTMSTVDILCLAQFSLYLSQWESNLSMMIGKLLILVFLRWALIYLPSFLKKV
jgi:hypothetical protein